MPTYEYFCQDCKNKFEVRASLSEKEKGLEVKCPKCGSVKTVQIFGNFFTFSKGGQSGFDSSSGINLTRGCCG